jgi:hypothetical protein
MVVHGDHEWQAHAGHRYGVFVFSKDGWLAGLEVWSIDGEAIPTELPDWRQLKPMAG